MEYANNCMLCDAKSKAIHDGDNTVITCTRCSLKISAEKREEAVAVWNGEVYYPEDCQECDDKSNTIKGLRSDLMALLKKIDSLKAELTKVKPV